MAELVYSKNKQIAKNTISLYVRMAVVLVITLFTTRVVLRSLGAEDYGIYTVVCGFVYLFSFLNSTLSLSINRYINYALGEDDSYMVTKVFNTSLRIQFIIAFVSLILVETVGVWYINEKLVVPPERLSVAKWIFQLSVLSLILTLLQAPFLAAVLAYERMGFYAIISILDAIFKLIIAFVVQYSDFDKLLFYGILMASVSIFNFAAYLLYSRLSFQTIRFSFGLDKKLFRSMLSFSGWSILNPIAFTARSQGCNVLLNYYGGPIINAAYTVANQVASALDSFSMSISVAFRPQLIQSYSAKMMTRTSYLCIMMSKIMYSLVLLLFVPLVLETEFIMTSWLGKDVPAFTVSFTTIVLLVKLVDSLNPAITNTIMATGNIRKYSIWSSIIISSVIPISYFTLKEGMSPNSVFVVMLFLTVINQIISVYLLKKTFPVLSIADYLNGVFFPCLAQTCLVVPIPLMLHYVISFPFLRLIIITFTSVSLSILFGYRVLLNRQEREHLQAFFKTKLFV